MTDIDQEVVELALEDDTRGLDIEQAEVELMVDGEVLGQDDPEVLSLRASLEEAEAELEKAHTVIRERDREASEILRELSQTTSKYRVALLASAPDVPEDMVQGQTVAELEESMARARQMVERIRNQMEAQVTSQRVPTRAQTRSMPDFSFLSPQEKIAYALAKSPM